MVTLYYGKGQRENGYPCLDCRETGFFGRDGVYEIMKMSETLRELTKRQSSSELRKYAIKEGMITLRQNALRKMLNGVTTIEETIKVVSGI